MKFQYSQLDEKMKNIESVLQNIEERDNSIYRIYFEASPISEDKRKAGFGVLIDTKNLMVLNTQT